MDDYDCDHGQDLMKDLHAFSLNKSDSENNRNIQDVVY